MTLSHVKSIQKALKIKLNHNNIFSSIGPITFGGGGTYKSLKKQ